MQYSEKLTSFGSACRSYRLQNNMLLYDMAQELGIGTAELSGYEFGRHEVPDEIVKRVRELYGIRVSHDRRGRGKCRNVRRVSILITPQTLHHLEELSCMIGCPGQIGRVIDKLVREKALAMRDISRNWRKEK